MKEKNSIYWKFVKLNFLIVSYFMRKIGLKFSSDFLNHSLAWDKKEMEYSNDSELAEKIKKTEAYYYEMKEIKKAVNLSKSKSFFKSGSIVFDHTNSDIDLFLSL